MQKTDQGSGEVKEKRQERSEQERLVGSGGGQGQGSQAKCDGGEVGRSKEKTEKYS